MKTVVDGRKNTRDLHFPLRIKVKISEYAPILTFSNYAWFSGELMKKKFQIFQ